MEVSALQDFLNYDYENENELIVDYVDLIVFNR